MDIRILDFDGSLTSQKRLLSAYNPRIIDFKDFSSSARLWMSRKTAGLISLRLEDISGGINFLGSGDFHHISSLTTEKISEPFILIVFDLHPDWDILPPFLGCGSWVTRSLRNKSILKCFLIGPSSQDIAFPYIQTGNLKLLENNRLEIYPYAHIPSTVFLRRVPSNSSMRLEKGFLRTKIYWDELKGKNLNDFLLTVISRLPTKKVYLSIDKDCLKSEYALTNWEEGYLSLEDLLMMLKSIRNNLDILGVDITGDYSKPFFSKRLKSFISRLDHPKDIKADIFSNEKISAVNELTNLKIISALFS
ncbi:MAG: hypothetical protein WC293_04755 [Candidatus Omnitrophota bacterium]|jgi:hypothetical protein|nr:hypothetical protein [Candidatus Omnitrophota bacterium]MDD4981514.1 hypothetical protein [Candidatus Omnitrophota bacterium]MDD5665415.1 hypothetical protein [Candidatus Omnitrophota bacterium]